MSKTLDFNKLKKKSLQIVLNDAEKTTLFVTTPSKKTLDEFLGAQTSLSDGMSEKSIGELYDLVAKLMNHNTSGVTVSKEKLEEIFDFEDISIFIRAYTEFIAEVTSSKN